jgi:hypothetical protein
LTPFSGKFRGTSMGLRSVPFVFSVFAAVALFAACNGQGEGDICDQRNGNNDCQNGYGCTQPSPPFVGDRCCPGDPSLATVPACKTGVASVNVDAAAPASAAEAGTTGDSAATTDTGTDGPSE